MGFLRGRDRVAADIFEQIRGQRPAPSAVLLSPVRRWELFVNDLLRREVRCSLAYHRCWEVVNRVDLWLDLLQIQSLARRSGAAAREVSVSTSSSEDSFVTCVSETQCEVIVD